MRRVKCAAFETAVERGVDNFDDATWDPYRPDSADYIYSAIYDTVL